MIKDKLEPILDNRFDIVETGFGRKNEALLNQVSLIKGEGLRHVPQLVMIMIEGENGEEQLFTMIHNNAHSNISSLFNEEGNRHYSNADLTLVRGVVGSYPVAYLSLTESEIPTLVKMLQKLNTEEDYLALLDKFAVRRSSPEFWPFSDRVHSWYRQIQPIEFGLFDYNRFENR